MEIREQFTIPSLLARQLLDKYNNQNARFNVEYIEAVIDDDAGTEFIGPRSLTLTESGNPYRGLWIRWKNSEKVCLIEYIRILKFHKDFCRIEVVCDDDVHYWAKYEPYRRD